MAKEYVRICPVCESENPPERARCGCGASLAGVDFSLKHAPVANADASSAPAAATDLAAFAVAAPERALPAGESADANTAPSTPDAAPSASIVCPYADCAQPNPPGGQRCVYCNRPLAAPSSAVAGARPLPSALRDDYRVVDVFPATGSEADILLVVDVRSGERRVAKLYRRGIAPDFRLLDVLAQSVGDAVVRVLAHGTSDGAAYELLEYIPGGTLEALLRSGPLPKSDVKRIVREIADALNGIHAQRILHRDLKPENVLIRQVSPLELALTDFGIASLSVATQHFTTAARTTKYAAPEVLTGVLDAKADWWSLGMIALEAASGRHPFDGLTEQVMNLQLATRPIDVRGVYDDELRLLCRGLLLRDPKRRWGGAEVERWLAADATLTVADEAETAVGAVRPYRFGKTEATTRAELALALARHWDDGRRDLARGQVARWLENELHAYNLVRMLRDLQDLKGMSDDARLLHFLLAAAPDLPPVWRGAPVSENAVLAAARAAANDGEGAQAWLGSLWDDGVLAIYAAAGHDALRTLDARWREAWNDFVARWEGVQRAEAAWRSQAREVGGSGGGRAVSYDDVVYVATGKLALPPQRTVNGALLLALDDASYVDALRGEVAAGFAQLAGSCPWFESFWEQAQADLVGVVAARLLLPEARDDAAMEARRQAASADARARSFDEAKDALRASLSELIALAPTGDEDLSSATVSQLLDGFNGFQQACNGVLRSGTTDADFDGLRRVTEKLSSLGLSAQRALAETEEIHGVNAIFLTPQRLVAGLAILGAALVLRVPAAFLLVLAGVALAIGYRWYVGYQATETALSRLRLFGLHARTFLRNDSAEDRGTDRASH
ncbi:MAG: serine/threonine protein kinase [Burkholderiales bacterium]|nr:serine/threonine protein kinase [Burkholderiales bacterium]